MMQPPKSSNADEWRLFLCQYLDNRANQPRGLSLVALSISTALEAAEEQGREMASDADSTADLG